MWCLSIPQVGVVTVTLPLKIFGEKSYNYLKNGTR